MISIESIEIVFGVGIGVIGGAIGATIFERGEVS